MYYGWLFCTVTAECRLNDRINQYLWSSTAKRIISCHHLRQKIIIKHILLELVDDISTERS